MHEDRLRCLRLWTLEERKNRQDAIDFFPKCIVLEGLVIFRYISFLFRYNVLGVIYMQTG